MNLKDKYFHGIHSYVDTYEHNERIEVILYKLNKILECGSILSSRLIIEKGNLLLRNKSKKLNGDDFVSISLHESSPEECDIKYKKETPKDYFENSFSDFILQEPSLVLNPSIRAKSSNLKNGGIYLERFVEGQISLENMVAISLFPFGILKPFFSDVKAEDFEKCYKDTGGYRSILIEDLDQIIEALNKHGYNVPIIDICSGREYCDNADYRQYIDLISKQKSKS